MSEGTWDRVYGRVRWETVGRHRKVKVHEEEKIRTESVPARSEARRPRRSEAGRLSNSARRSWQKAGRRSAGYMRIGYRKPEGQAKTERVTDIRKMTVREP